MFVDRPSPPLRQVIARHRLSLATSHALTGLEQAARLGQPLALGLAVNDLLASSYRGLMTLVVLHVTQLGLASWRRSRDSRVFGRLSADLASLELIGSRRVAASAGLRFHQRQAPAVIRATMSILGVLLVIGLFDPMLLPASLALLGPAAILQVVQGRQTPILSDHPRDHGARGEWASPGDTGRTSGASGGERWNGIVMELLVVGLLAATLVRVCAQTGATPGGLVAIVRYLSIYAGALDGVPLLVGQLRQWRDARCVDSSPMGVSVGMMIRE
jgi:hypothetical protein